MKFSRIVFAVVLMGVSLPGLATAATCTDAYYKCLNDSWEASGLEKYMANLECGVAYYGCVRRLA